MVRNPHLEILDTPLDNSALVFSTIYGQVEMNPHLHFSIFTCELPVCTWYPRGFELSRSKECRHAMVHWIYAHICDAFSKINPRNHVIAMKSQRACTNHLHSPVNYWPTESHATKFIDEHNKLLYKIIFTHTICDKLNYLNQSLCLILCNIKYSAGISVMNSQIVH